MRFRCDRRGHNDLNDEAIWDFALFHRHRVGDDATSAEPALGSNYCEFFGRTTLRRGDELLLIDCEIARFLAEQTLQSRFLCLCLNKMTCTTYFWSDILTRIATRFPCLWLKLDFELASSSLIRFSGGTRQYSGTWYLLPSSSYVSERVPFGTLIAAVSIIIWANAKSPPSIASAAVFKASQISYFSNKSLPKSRVCRCMYWRRKRGENGLSGSKKNGKARKGTGTKTGLPFSETGDETRFLREKRNKSGTKKSRKQDFRVKKPI